MEKKKSLLDIESIINLAKKFALQNMYDEAINLYEIASKLNPESLAIKMNIARLKELKNKAIQKQLQILREKFEDEKRKDDIDVGHLVGLAKFYFEKNENTKAIEQLEIAKLKNPYRLEIFSTLGRYYFKIGEWEMALKEINQALKLNPFDYELLELQGRIYFELQNYKEALLSFLDAYLLTISHTQRNEKIQRMIKTLSVILDLKKEEMKEIYRERLEGLENAIDRLALKKEILKEKEKALHQIFLKKTKEDERKENWLQLANEMRALQILKHFRDDEIFNLSGVVKIHSQEKNSYLFREREMGFDVYILKAGEVLIQKDTPFGAQLLFTVMPGEIFGEMNFISRISRSADAFVSKDSFFYILPFANLEDILEKNKELAVSLYWSFWKSLSDKLRSANEVLKTFFTEEMKMEEKLYKKEEKRRSQKIKIDENKKMDLFHEKGLSPAEIRLLATFSQEENYESDSIIFREGEVGDKLYIILDGQVRISKFIPGIGEEALAILGRGEFFGEMALIDGSPRSADARAHGRGVTILSIDKKTLGEILKMDPAASLQFLNLLTKMLTQRLKEINDKIIQWRYIVGVGG